MPSFGLSDALSPFDVAVLRETECQRLLDTLRELDVAVSSRRYERGRTIYGRGEEGGGLYVLTEGAVGLFGGYNGPSGARRDALRLVGPWELFGHPVFAGCSRRNSAEAFTDCEVVKVPRPFLERTIRRREEAALGVETLLELVLVEQEETLGCLLPRKTQARLARLVPILLGKFCERDMDGRPMVGLRLTRLDLGAMIGTTRESVNGAMRDLQKRGILEAERGRIVVLDPEALAEIAEG
jgi:CRP/FNR family transcriptional regulator, global nitrogen regulator